MESKNFDPNGAIPDNGNYFGIPLSPDDAALVLISAPWDITVSQRAGSSYAPDAIIEASRRVDFFEPMAPYSWRKGLSIRLLNPVKQCPLTQTTQQYLPHSLPKMAKRQ